MTLGDINFLRQMGIVPCDFGDPSHDTFPLSPPTEAPIPKLEEADSGWLQDLRVVWDQDPEPGFIPPKTLQEYLVRYPNGIREAVEVVAKEMGIALTSGGIDELAKELVQTFIGFVEAGLEDIVAFFEFDQHVPIGACLSVRFHSYIKVRVAALAPVILKQDPSDDNNC